MMLTRALLAHPACTIQSLNISLSCTRLSTATITLSQSLAIWRSPRSVENEGTANNFTDREAHSESSE